jgi:glycosyltransferase involved in cell wall biosynthesis
MKEPLISIIIPVYNRAELIKETLDSVLAQTYSNWECLVVDDGSIDNTWEVLNDYSSKDERIRIIKRNRSPKGANTCRNIGAEDSRGEYLLFFDSDDIFFPWCIETLTQFIRRNNGFEFGSFQQLVRSSFNHRMWYRCVKDTPENYLLRYLNFRIALSTACLWKKVSFYKTDQWDEKLSCWQDPPLIVSALLKQLRFYWISDEPLTMIRMNSDAGQTTNKLKLSNYLFALHELNVKLNSEERKILKKSIKRKIWEKGNYSSSYEELNNEIRIAKSFNFINSREYRILDSYFKLFFWLKNVPLLRYLVYKGQYLFYKKQKNERVIVTFNDLSKTQKEFILKFIPEISDERMIDVRTV